MHGVLDKRSLQTESSGAKLSLEQPCARAKHAMTDRNPVLSDIRAELRRLKAEDVRVRWDEDFEPESGPLIEVAWGDSYWHILPKQFRELLQQLDDGVGEQALKHAIEQQGVFVWHGPSPRGSRDTTR